LESIATHLLLGSNQTNPKAIQYWDALVYQIKLGPGELVSIHQRAIFLFKDSKTKGKLGSAKHRHKNVWNRRAFKPIILHSTQWLL
jgi:hypothetical protein